MVEKLTRKIKAVSEKEFGILIELFQQERAFKYDFTFLDQGTDSLDFMPDTSRLPKVNIYRLTFIRKM